MRVLIINAKLVSAAKLILSNWTEYCRVRTEKAGPICIQIHILNTNDQNVTDISLFYFLLAYIGLNLVFTLYLT